MIINLFLLLVKSNIYSPTHNSINYVNNNLNISWQNNFTESNIHIFLLQNEAIVKYPNNSNILSNVIPNNGYYNWIPPYDLNKYHLNHMSFQFLLSNSSNPFSATLGHNQKNILGNNFYLETNVNISSPLERYIFIPNTNVSINSNGFIENVNCSIIDTNDNVIDSFIMQNNYYNYNIPQYFQDYRNGELQLVLVEQNSGITRSVSNLKTSGINILPYSLSNSEIILNWENVNFVGSNILEIYFNTDLIEDITLTSNNFSYDLLNNYGEYDFIIYDQNRFTFSVLTYNYLSTSPTSTQTTTYTSTQSTTPTTTETFTLTTNSNTDSNTNIIFNGNFNNITNTTNNSDELNESDWLKIVIGFIVLVILLLLSTYYYAYGCNCPHKRRRKKRYCCCFTKKDSKISPYNNKETQTRKSYLNKNNTKSKNRLPPISNSRHLNNETYGSNETYCNTNTYSNTNTNPYPNNFYNNVYNSNYVPKYQTPNDYNSLNRPTSNNSDENRNKNHYNKLDKNSNRNLTSDYRNLDRQRQNKNQTHFYDEPEEYNDTIISNSFTYYSKPENSSNSRPILKNDTYYYSDSKYERTSESYNLNV